MCLCPGDSLAEYMADFQPASRTPSWRHEYLDRVLSDPRPGIDAAGGDYLPAGRHRQRCHRPRAADHRHGAAGAGYAARAGCRLVDRTFDPHQPLATGGRGPSAGTAAAAGANAGDDLRRHPGRQRLVGHQQRPLGGACPWRSAGGLCRVWADRPGAERGAQAGVVARADLRAGDGRGNGRYRGVRDAGSAVPAKPGFEP
ncbi:hypothetical protein D3C79_836670 [compost metagenome]